MCSRPREQNHGQLCRRPHARGHPAATDSTRVLRIPGFKNRKYETEFLVQAEKHADRVSSAGFPAAERPYAERLQAASPSGAAHCVTIKSSVAAHEWGTRLAYACPRAQAAKRTRHRIGSYVRKQLETITDANEWNCKRSGYCSKFLHFLMRADSP